MPSTAAAKSRGKAGLGGTAKSRQPQISLLNKQIGGKRLRAKTVPPGGYAVPDTDEEESLDLLSKTSTPRKSSRKAASTSPTSVAEPEMLVVGGVPPEFSQAMAGFGPPLHGEEEEEPSGIGGEEDAEPTEKEDDEEKEEVEERTAVADDTNGGEGEATRCCISIVMQHIII